MGIYGNENNNWLFGTSQNDYINGLLGNDLIFGGYGNDILYGGYTDNYGVPNDNDTIYGGWGDDTIISGNGRDELYGDMGDDTFIITTWNPWTTIDGGLGSDTLDFSWYVERRPDDGIDIRLPSDWTGFEPQFSSIENVIGTQSRDTIRGSDQTNVIDGNGGDDRIYGEGGDDWLDGGSGDDIARGGAGNDVVLGGLGNDLLSGESGSDKLDGGSGHDTLTGGANHDQMTGGTGADHFVFDDTDDRAGVNDTWGEITDFSGAQGDQIDLSDFGNLNFVGDSNFSFLFTGQVRIERDPWNLSHATLEIDLNGDRMVDGRIDISFGASTVLDTTDFIL